MTKEINKDFVNLVSRLQSKGFDNSAIKSKVTEFFTGIIESTPDKEEKSNRENLASKARNLTNSLDDFSRSLFCIIFNQHERLFQLAAEREGMGLNDKLSYLSAEREKIEKAEIDLDEKASLLAVAREEVGLSIGSDKGLFQTAKKWYENPFYLSLAQEKVNLITDESDNRMDYESELGLQEANAAGPFDEPKKPIEFLVPFVRKSFYILDDEFAKKLESSGKDYFELMEGRNKCLRSLNELIESCKEKSEPSEVELGEITLEEANANEIKPEVSELKSDELNFKEMINLYSDEHDEYKDLKENYNFQIEDYLQYKDLQKTLSEYESNLSQLTPQFRESRKVDQSVGEKIMKKIDLLDQVAWWMHNKENVLNIRWELFEKSFGRFVLENESGCFGTGAVISSNMEEKGGDLDNKEHGLYQI